MSCIIYKAIDESVRRSESTLARTRGRVPSQVFRRGQLSRRRRLVARARQDLPTAFRAATDRSTRATISNILKLCSRAIRLSFSLAAVLFLYRLSLWIRLAWNNGEKSKSGCHVSLLRRKSGSTRICRDLFRYSLVRIFAALRNVRNRGETRYFYQMARISTANILPR